MLTNLLADLRRLGIEVWSENGQLRYRAPARTLTDDLRAELTRHKTSLLALLQETRAPALEYEPLPAVTPDPERRHEPFPLTDIQHAYWIGRGGGVELGNVATHAYFEFERAGLDVERLGHAWRTLIARHDMLRAVVQIDGQQRVLADVPTYSISVLDVRAASPAEAQARTEAVREQLAHHLYDAARWPLFAVRATRLPGGRVRVHVSIDLLIADVWSLFILFREWGALYEQPDRPLTPLTLSFRDYVLAEAGLHATPRYTRAQGYWSARLPALTPGPDLPLARPAGAIARPHFSRRSGRLPAPMWQQLRMRARQMGLTPSMVLCTAFAEVLSAWSTRPAFTLNVTLFQRLPLHPEVNAVVGDFTSTVLLAVDDHAGLGFAERVRRLQQQLWRDLEHRDVSGVRVLRDLARRNGGGPRVAMPVVFTSTLGPDANAAAPAAWLGDLVYGISQTPQVWLDHQVGEDGDALAFNWDVVDALFPDGLVDAMFDAYCARAAQLADDDEAWAAPTPALIPKTEVHARTEINATTVEWPDVTLYDLVAAQVRQRPEQTAVLSPTRQLTYAEVGGAAAVVAQWLWQHRVHANELVAVVMEKGWEQVVASVGVVRSGAAYLPIDADVPADRLALLLAQGDTTLVLTQSWLIERLTWPAGMTFLAVDRIEWDRAAISTSLVQSPEPRAQPDDLAYVIFTSGSTGIPKGVMLTHRAVVNTLLDINRRWSIGPADRVLALSSLSFDLSVFDIFGVLAAGGTVILPSPDSGRDPGHWLALLTQHRITVWNTVPALMQLLMEGADSAGARLTDSLRLVLLSGDWIPVRLPDRIRAHVPEAQVVSLGGATEAAIWSIVYPIGTVDPAWRSIPYGRPLANQTWHVLHADATPCPVWVAGELYIGGAGLAEGYWRDPVRTSERFVRHPRTGERLYRTGDWGRYRPDGDIEFLGRDDLQVKVQGHRIELGEIETALSRHPDIAQAVVTTYGERMGEKRLLAFVVPRAALHRDPAALRAWLHRTLPAYMVPAAIHVVAALPLTSNGKIDRSVLLGLASPSQPDRVSIPPRDDLERQLVGIWEDVLGAGSIGVTDRFFDIGGDSFLAVRLMIRVQRDLGITLPVSALFQANDVESLARIIRERPPSSTSSLVRLSSGGIPPFFCVHPIGGHVMCYLDLTRCLGDSRACYGIQARGLHGEAAPFSNIAVMARHYLEEIRAVQPHGPYLLGGWSMGGTVAFEMAQQLRAQGETIALLVLIDSETSVVAASASNVERDLDRHRQVPPDLDANELHHLFDVVSSHDRALSAYREQTYCGPVSVIRAREQPDGRAHDLGWGDLVTGGVEVHVVPGDHYTMLQRPHVEALASRLRRCFESVEQMGG
jgi:amino acid adenylation domain-containing protein